VRVKRFPKFTIVLITWEDTTSDAKWYSKQKVEKVETTTVKTIGFFIENKKRILKIAHSVTAGGDSDYTVIPWGCIKGVKELETK